MSTTTTRIPMSIADAVDCALPLPAGSPPTSVPDAVKLPLIAQDGQTAVNGFSASPLTSTDSSSFDDNIQTAVEIPGEASPDEEEEEVLEVEPKFKYERLLLEKNPDSANILFRDSATCLAVHPKILALGTKNGEIYVLDLQGNRISLPVPIPKHAGPVTDISIDEAGDTMASAGDDGKVFVHGLYHTDDNSVIKHSEPVKAVAISPNFTTVGLSIANKSVVFGSRQLILCEKRFLGTKLTTLDPGDGRITGIKWHGNLLAWGNKSGVKVMDMKEKQVIGVIPKDQRKDGYDFPNKCDLFWANPRTLLVSWPHVFHVCSIRDRRMSSTASLSSGGLSAKLSSYELVVNKLIHTDFAIAGIGPYVEDQIVLLGYNASAQEENKKVQLRIIRPNWEAYEDITCDELTLRGALYATYEDYKLYSLPDDGMYFIVSPKDVVVAKPLDLDGVIDWMLARGRFEEAMQVAAKDSGRTLAKHNMRDIGRQYLEYLRSKDNYEEAARNCPKILGKDRMAWEEQIAEFARAGKLRTLAPYMPRSTDVQISQALYELVLSSFLQADHEGFLRIVKEWPSTLYSVQAVINAVIEYLLRNPNQKTLLEALGVLYSLVRQFDKALAIYVKLKHNDVFDLIARHNLYRTVTEKQLTMALFEVSAEQTVKMLTDNIDSIPLNDVVKQLEPKPKHLLAYLDRLFHKDKTVTREYHDLQVKLYAEHDPKKLLNFMQNSKDFKLNIAYEICQRQNMVPEMVYLLSRMGNPKKALDLILHGLKDIKRAIDFCKEQNDNELWMLLIDYSLDKPDFITELLHSIGTHVDPGILIRNIKNGLKIPGLRDSLVRILHDYNLQITLREGCRKIMVSDCYQLLAKLSKVRRRGFSVDHESVCHICKNVVLVSGNRGSAMDSGVTVFQCKHAFHTDCALASGTLCPVCAPKRRHDLFS